MNNCSKQGELSATGNTLLKAELWGIPVIFLIGSLFHFAFELTGKLIPLAGIFAVNESVWEHAKLAFYAPLIYGIVEYFILRHAHKGIVEHSILHHAHNENAEHSKLRNAHNENAEHSILRHAHNGNAGHSILRHPLKGITLNNMLTAKAVASTVSVLVMIMLFYTYTGITGSHSLIADLIIFLLSVAAGQLSSYILLSKDRLPPRMNRAALVYLVIMLVMFYVLTFYPPHIPLFYDTSTGKYGL